MHTNHFRILLFLVLTFLVVSLALSACGRTSSEESGSAGDTGDTSAAATIAAQAAQLTIQAQSAQLTTTAQSALYTQQAINVAPQEPAPQHTQKSGEPFQGDRLKIIGLESTNCREGPLSDYEIVGALGQGESSIVHGTNADKSWWYIENLQRPGEYCWVWAATTQVSGDTNTLELVQPPPPPEPAVGDCAPPYDWTPGFSTPEVIWQGSGANTRLEISQSTVIEPRCSGVTLILEILVEDQNGSMMWVGSKNTQTDTAGRASFTTTTGSLDSTSSTPTEYKITWSFAIASDGPEPMLITGPIQPPP